MVEKIGEATRADVMEIVKKALTEAGYDVYEDAQAYEFKCAEAEKKRQKRAEEKAKKIEKSKKEKAE